MLTSRTAASAAMMASKKGLWVAGGSVFTAPDGGAARQAEASAGTQIRQPLPQPVRPLLRGWTVCRKSLNYRSLNYKERTRTPVKPGPPHTQNILTGRGAVSGKHRKSGCP